MNYLRSLNLNREPFSNTPDPEFFYHSRQHLGCLQKVEVSVRLRRGLNVVIGDVGMGKTTLCRQLIRFFAGDRDLETYLILDPSFDSPLDFLNKIAEMFSGQKPPAGAAAWDIKEIIKKFLFKKGIEENRTIVLIIDEGQKTPDYCLELLREFLNYETNEFKLLQIVIFAQKEFEEKIRRLENFTDRINLYRVLEPFRFKDTRAMIKYRIRKAVDEDGEVPSLFTIPALWAIYRATGGYPRKIITLCHQCLLAVIIENRKKVDLVTVRSCSQGTVYTRRMRKRRLAAIGLAAALLAGAAVVGLNPDIILALRQPAEQPALEQPEALPLAASTAVVTRTIEDLPRPLPVVTAKDAAPAAVPDAMSAEKPATLPAPAGVAGENSGSGVIGQSVRIGALIKSKDDSGSGLGSAESPESGTPALGAAIAAVSSVDMPAGQDAASGVVMPETLGEIRIQRGETVSSMMRALYGYFNTGDLAEVARCNPRLPDLEKVPVGFPIRFPVLRQDIRPMPGVRWWIEIRRADNLSAAWEVVRQHPELRDKLRIVPFWHKRDGLVFTVVSRQYWTEKEAAVNQMKTLPFSGFENAGVSSDVWDSALAYFSDPLAAAD